ncbi:MAG: SCO family protein [Chromatiaceae bacterium]|nr:SCO family protein [Chromatiaceae bacterium]
MHHRLRIAPAAVIGFALVAWVLAGLAKGPTAFAQAPASAGHDPHAHHHHPAPASVSRSQAHYSIPDVTLVDQEGRPVILRDLLNTDKPILANFIFTTCTAICPAMSATFQQVGRELAGDRDQVMMVSFSIDPEQDNPSALAHYAERFDAGPQWVLLTGSLEDSIRVQKAFDAYRGDKMNHAPLSLLRIGHGENWVRFDGFASATDLVTELRAGMERSASADLAPAAVPKPGEMASYAIGYELGGYLSGLARQGGGVDPGAMLQGALDALAQAEPRVSQEAMRQALAPLEADPPAVAESGEATATPNPPPARTLGFVDDFAVLNAKRPGVVTLPSGVQYEILNAGQGRRPDPPDRVALRYEGRLTTGVVFDSTHEDPEPARLRVEEILVPGLREALLLMREGDRWRVVVPPALGFAAAGNNLLRKRDLIYEIELVAIEPATPGSITQEGSVSAALLKADAALGADPAASR